MADGALAVAVLAAGLASRFGGGKLDAPCAGKPVGRHVLDAAELAGLGHFAPLCITGPEAPLFVQEARGWQRIINPDPALGLASSVAVAAAHARQHGYAAMVVLLADMPLITPAFINDLASRSGAAATLYPEGRPGVPARFPAALFPALERLEGEGGAGQFLRGLADVELLHPAAPMLADVDRPADLAAAEAALISRQRG